MRTIIYILLPIVHIYFSNAFGQSSQQRTGFLSNTLESSELFEQKIKQKKPAVAFLLSSGTTTASVLAGLVLAKNGYDTSGGLFIIGGLLLGPSVGHMYVGNGSGVLKGIGTRILGGSIALIGGYVILATGLGDALGGESSPAAEIMGSALLFGGLGLVAYSAIYDWINSAKYAKKMNERQKGLQISPAFDAYTGKPIINLKLTF